MTSVQKVYDAFLAKQLEDEWSEWTLEEIKADLRQILDGAIPWFKFPRVDLTIIEPESEDEDPQFAGDLSNEEIQILAVRMKCEWLNRSILTWENIKVLYEERDFSQANLLNKLNETLEREEKKALRLESIYYRSIKSRPFNYGNLAGGA